MGRQPYAKRDGLPADFIERVGEYLELVVAGPSFGRLPMLVFQWSQPQGARKSWAKFTMAAMSSALPSLVIQGLDWRVVGAGCELRREVNLQRRLI